MTLIFLRVFGAAFHELPKYQGLLLDVWKFREVWGSVKRIKVYIYILYRIVFGTKFSEKPSQMAKNQSQRKVDH